MKSVNQEYKIKSPLKKVWDALTQTSEIKKWGAGPAKMKAEEGYKFSLWGGDIHGVNTKVVTGKLLAQDWMAGKWENYSKVVFKLKEDGGVTTVNLTQTGIPDAEYKDIADGWNRYYMGEIKKLLEGKN